MIGYIRRLILLFFNLVHAYYHQKRIASYLKKKVDKIEIFFDVGSHMGTYTDLIKKDYPNSKSYLFEPQSKIFKKIE